MLELFKNNNNKDKELEENIKNYQFIKWIFDEYFRICKKNYFFIIIYPFCYIYYKSLFGNKNERDFYKAIQTLFILFIGTFISYLVHFYIKK